MNERLSRIIHSPLLVPIGVGIVAFGTGGVAGYILGRRNSLYLQEHEDPVQMKFDHGAMEKLIAAHEEAAGIEPPQEDVPHYVHLTKEESAVEVGEVFVKEIIQTERPLIMAPPVEAPVARSIFAGNSDDWNYEEELATRSEAEPFVIHKDEFYADEMEYTQSTLTYYSGDNILVDEDDTPIYNHDSIVGPLLFGHGSGDPNVFHVRNDKRKAEYEILFDPGYYSVEVLGIEMEEVAEKELKHSSIRRFRLDD